MNYPIRVLTLILSIAMYTFGLKAIIKNQAGVPLSGVAVSFAKVDTTVYSDAAGVVNCDIITPIITPQNSAPSASLRFNGSGFSLSLPTAMDVSLSLYSPRGQEIMHHKETMKNGNHLILPPTIADGIYLMKLQVGDDQFTSKIVRGQSITWKGSAIAQALSGSRGYSAVDTVTFAKSGFANLRKPIESYKGDLGVITLDSIVLNNNYYGLQKYDIDTTLPSFVNVLFRVYDSLGNNIPTITTEKLLIKEDGEPISSAESELTLETVSDFQDSTQTVLLIDNSKSVEANLPKIKAAAKEMIRNLIPRQQVAVYAFSENCVKVQAFTSDTTTLIEAIDAIPTGYSSTNLYGSLITAFADVDNHADVQLKEITFGNVVLFTDGKDTQGSSTLAQVLAAQGDIRVFAVGFGQEIDLGMDALKEIALDNVYTTTDPDKLGILFKEVQTQISNVANSYYWAHYRSPKRGDVDHTLTVGIKGNENSKKDATITGTFNSKLFQAGWAPTAKNLKIELNATSDTLIASYEYEDKDGEAEGNSEYQWYVDSMKWGNTLKLPIASMKYSCKITFEVLPKSLSGSPKAGKWHSLGVALFVGEQGVTFGYSGRDGAYSICANGDGYILTGFITPNPQIITERRMWILQVDNDGDTLWSKRFGDTLDNVGLTSITTDSGCIVVGQKAHDSLQSDVSIIQLNNDGNIIWSKVVGTEEHDKISAITKSKSGFILTGCIETLESREKQLWVFEINTEGDTLWSKKCPKINLNDVGRGIVKADNGYIIAGYTYDESINKKTFLLKINDEGSVLWHKIYDDSKSYCITKAENGYIVGGEGETYQLFKVDENGDTLWTLSDGSSYKSIIRVDDGYLAVGGFSNGSSSIATVAKFSENGDYIWINGYGEDNREIGYSIVPSENAFLLTGTSYSLKNNGQDIFLNKIDSNGNCLWKEIVIK